MPLVSTRFESDPTLEDCLAGNHRMLALESGPAVRKVQEALIDLGFPLPLHGADSEFGSETGVAVVAYKRTQGLHPDDPVVGPGTMAALDRDCADKPPFPFADRAEWASWRDRAAEPTIGLFNFTRADELARRAAGTSFTFDANSTWLPPIFQTAITQSLSALLEPTGSPSGPGTDAATWGVGPFDLYHCHLVLSSSGALPVPQELQDGQLALRGRLDRLQKQAEAVPGAVPFNAVFGAAYRTLILSSDVRAFAGQLASDSLGAPPLAQPVRLVWHTFESERWRPATVVPTSPQRHWQTLLTPTLGTPIPFPFVTPAQLKLVADHLFEIAFIVTKAGVITAMPGSLIELLSVAGFSVDDVLNAT
jgi:hypothetical protein